MYNIPRIIKYKNFSQICIIFVLMSFHSYLKVAKVTDDISVFLLVTFVLESENCRDEVREAQELSDDGVSPGDDPEDGLAAQVVLRQEVQHVSGRCAFTVHTQAINTYNSRSKCYSC